MIDFISCIIFSFLTVSSPWMIKSPMKNGADADQSLFQIRSNRFSMAVIGASAGKAICRK